MMLPNDHEQWRPERILAFLREATHGGAAAEACRADRDLTTGTRKVVPMAQSIHITRQLGLPPWPAPFHA
jgi:hypothetical protein